MTDCKFLAIDDVTPYHGDVFDHPDYKYTCKNATRKLFLSYIVKKKNVIITQRCKINKLEENNYETFSNLLYGKWSM